MTTTDETLRDRFRRAAPVVPPHDALLDALRAEASRRRRRRRTAAVGLAALAASAAVVLGIAVTTDDDRPPQEVDLVAPTPKPETAAPQARDWDGARFDFGRIERVHREGDDWLLDFDRVQLHTDDGLRSGPDFTEEPVVVGTTDEPTVNENRRLRTYALRADAEALVIDNLSDTCSDLEVAAPPRWRRLTLDELAADPQRWSSFTQVSLTFDPEGLVMRIRLSRGC